MAKSYIWKVFGKFSSAYACVRVPSGAQVVCKWFACCANMFPLSGHPDRKRFHSISTDFNQIPWKTIEILLNRMIFMKTTDFHENHTFPWKSLIFPGKPLFGHENHNISTEITIIHEKANFHENHTFPWKNHKCSWKSHISMKITYVHENLIFPCKYSFLAKSCSGPLRASNVCQTYVLM